MEFFIGFAVVSIIFNFLDWKNKNIEEQETNALHSPTRKIRDMTGKEFEDFVASLFTKMGYQVFFTPDSQDYGADLILYKDGLKIVVQTKRWKDKVGVKAVQEIASAVPYYNAEKGMVITNNLFTKYAYKLARSLDIELWDGYKLIEFIKCANKAG